MFVPPSARSGQKRGAPDQLPADFDARFGAEEAPAAPSQPLAKVYPLVAPASAPARGGGGGRRRRQESGEGQAQEGLRGRALGQGQRGARQLHPDLRRGNGLGLPAQDQHCTVYAVWLETHLELVKKPAKWWDALEAEVQPAIGELFSQHAATALKPVRVIASAPKPTPQQQPAVASPPAPTQNQGCGNPFASDDWSRRGFN